MSAGEIATQPRRIRVPIAAMLVIGAFVVGAGSGAGIIRSFDSRSQVPTAANPAVQAPLCFFSQSAAYCRTTVTRTTGQTEGDAARAALTPVIRAAASPAVQAPLCFFSQSAACCGATVTGTTGQTEGGAARAALTPVTRAAATPAATP